MLERIVTLNLGLGMDSMTMLCLLREGKLRVEGRVLEPGDITAAVTSHTGREWPHFHEAREAAAEICRELRLPYYFLEKPSPEGPRGWAAWLEAVRLAKLGGEERPDPFWRSGRERESLEVKAAAGYYHLRPDILSDYSSRRTVVSISKGDCTDNHKIGPIRRLIGDLCLELYGQDVLSWGREVRRGERRPHLTLVGYTAGEARRLVEEGKSRTPSYVTEGYPLREMGIDKPDEIAILARHGLDRLVMKTGCDMCPYQPASWFWALRETRPDYFAEVAAYERRALEDNPRMLVMGGKRPLEQVVAEWRAANPDARVEEVLRKSYIRCDGRRPINV